MVLVPKARYERLSIDDKEHQDKINYYISILRDNGVNFTEKVIGDKKLDFNDGNSAEVNSSKEGVSTMTPSLKDTTKVEQEKETPQDNEATWSNAVVTASPMEIASQLPEKYRLYGKRLLEYIKKHGEDIVGWSEQGEVIYDGEIMAKTNITSLVEYIFKKDGKPPHGLKDLKKSLKAIRTPKSFLKPFLLKPPGIPYKIKNNWRQY